VFCGGVCELGACAAATIANSATKLREISHLRNDIWKPPKTRSVTAIILPIASLHRRSFPIYLDANQSPRVTRHFRQSGV
jgi:hypothetical protein